MVAALHYRHRDDRQSQELAEQIERQGLPAVLENVCQISPENPLSGEIQHAWKEWAL